MKEKLIDIVQSIDTCAEKRKRYTYRGCCQSTLFV